MNCKELKNNLYFYVTGEIEPDVKSEIRNHMDKCPECQKSFEGFNKTLNFVNAGRITAPEKNWNYFAEKIFDKIHNATAYRFLKPVAVISIISLVFILGYRQYSTRTSPGNMTLTEAEGLANYLTDFDIPELNQDI